MAERHNPVQPAAGTARSARGHRVPLRSLASGRAGVPGQPEAEAGPASCPAAGFASPRSLDPAGEPEAVLLIAACAGPRCRALRSLHDRPAAAAGPCDHSLGDAVRCRPGAVLLSTGCLGPCERACTAAVGWAVSSRGRLRWFGRPAGLGMVEMPPRAAALAAWIAGTAPDLATLPEPLWSTGA